MIRLHRPIVQPLESRTYFAAGDPIDTFGIGGLATFPEAMQRVTPVSIHETPDGKILVGVTQQAIGDEPITLGGDLVQFNTDGSLDTTFGDDGIVDTFFFDLKAVTPTAGGRYFAVGTVNDRQRLARPTWWLARFHGDGTLDRRFGDRGRVLIQTRVMRSALRPEFAHLSRDGVVTLNGTAPSTSTTGPIQIARFRPDGTPDPVFSVDGILEADKGSLRIAEISNDGSIYLVQDTATTNSGVLRKLTPRGKFDKTFGTNGDVAGKPGTRFDSVNEIGGDLYVELFDSSLDYTLVKLDTRGRTNRAFGAGGAVMLNPNVHAYNIIRQADGKLVLPRTTSERLNADGSLDTTFSTTGLFASHQTLSRDGVLYSADDNAIYATSLDSRGTSIATRGSNGQVTLFGTSREDSLQVEALKNYDFRDSQGSIRVQRQGRYQYFDISTVTSVVVEAGSGDDYVKSIYQNSITIIGGAGDDRLNASGIALRYATGLENAPGTGIFVSGGAGNDTIYVDGTAFKVEAGDGDDVIFGSYPFGETTTGRPASTLSGGRGNDFIQVSATPTRRSESAFILFGDTGNDYLRSSYTSDTLTGGAGTDTLRSGGGIDVLNRDDDDAE